MRACIAFVDKLWYNENKIAVYFDSADAPDDKEVFTYTIEPGVTATIFISSTMLTSSSPTSHNASFSINNRYNMVGSSTVPLEYDGYGIVGRDVSNLNDPRPNGSIVYPPHGVWKMNDGYAFDITGKPIPTGLRDYFGGRSTLAPNEKHNNVFLDFLKTPDDYDLFNTDYGLFAKRNAAYEFLGQTLVPFGSGHGAPEDTPNVNPGFGLMNTYTITLHNTGTATRKFSYMFDGSNFKVQWAARKNGVIYDGSSKPVDLLSQIPCEAFCVDIPGKSVVVITIDVSIVCGGNPTAHNAFIIDVDSNDLLKTEVEEEIGEVKIKKIYTEYTKGLYDVNRARTYPYGD